MCALKGKMHQRKEEEAEASRMWTELLCLLGSTELEPCHGRSNLIGHVLCIHIAGCVKKGTSPFEEGE